MPCPIPKVYSDLDVKPVPKLILSNVSSVQSIHRLWTARPRYIVIFHSTSQQHKLVSAKTFSMFFTSKVRCVNMLRGMRKQHRLKSHAKSNQSSLRNETDFHCDLITIWNHKQFTLAKYDKTPIIYAQNGLMIRITSVHYIILDTSENSLFVSKSSEFSSIFQTFLEHNDILAYQHH